MASLSNSLVLTKNQPNQLSSGSSVVSHGQGFVDLPFGQRRVANVQLQKSKRTRSIRAEYSGDGRSNAGSVFVGGFVLGGLIVGTLGCVYAPQISKAIAAADKKEILRKLPNFIYDEEKALEKTRKKLAEKIAQLNSAIDDVSSQLKSDDDDDESNADGGAFAAAEETGAVA